LPAAKVMWLSKCSSIYTAFFIQSYSKLKQEVLGRTNCLFTFHYTLSIGYDMDGTENTASNSSPIVAYVFVASEMYLSSHCLAPTGVGTEIHRKLIS
jgi:hypothetical protein